MTGTDFTESVKRAGPNSTPGAPSCRGAWSPQGLLFERKAHSPTAQFSGFSSSCFEPRSRSGVDNDDGFMLFEWSSGSQRAYVRRTADAGTVWEGT